MNPKKVRYDKRFPMPTTQTLVDWQEYVLRMAQEEELNRALEDHDRNINYLYDRQYEPRTDAN